MKEKTRKRIHLAVIWILLLLFAASGVLLYLPTTQDADPSASPAPAQQQQQQAPFGY
ncbi:MAG: hypothetical protein Q8Q11_02690 [bacterium]|nr:hypothetical protein [bacterium]MDZ4247953.1 hypothetical protein [Patescibacteria group bacterium]